jgi:hypothetical protein
VQARIHGILRHSALQKAPDLPNRSRLKTAINPGENGKLWMFDQIKTANSFQYFRTFRTVRFPQNQSHKGLYQNALIRVL